MASVRIRIDDFEDGVLPGVCAGTGAPGARLYHVTASSRTPGWAWLALFAGPAGFVFLLLAGSFLRKTAQGYLPYSEHHQARMLHRIRTSAAVAAGGLVLLVLSLFVRTGIGFGNLGIAGFVVGGITVTLGVFLWANPPGSVGLTLDGTGRWIEVDTCSNGFAFAYEQQEARRRAARRSEVLDPTTVD